MKKVASLFVVVLLVNATTSNFILSAPLSPLSSVTNVGVADPTLLPKAFGQVPILPKDIDQTSIGPKPNIVANTYYTDPTSGVKVWRATSPIYPCSNNDFSAHDYGDVLQISGDLGGNKHTLFFKTCGEYKLVDFVRGQGFGNWRGLAYDAQPAHDLSFTFSYSKTNPHIAYITTGEGKLVRYNTLINKSEPSGHFPKSWSGVAWLQNDKYDKWFVGTTADNASCVAFNAETNQTMTQTIPNFDECHLENNGRWVDLNTGQGGDYVWDLQSNTIKSFNPPDPAHIFHNASPSGYFTARDVNIGGSKYPMYRMDPVDSSSTLISDFGGYGTGEHESGVWLQEETPVTKQWIMYSAFGDHNYGGSKGYIFQASGFYRLDGSDFRFLAHTYHIFNDEYWETPFTTCAVDGKICMFNSNMSGKGDVYVAEVPLWSSTNMSFSLPSITPLPMIKTSSPNAKFAIGDRVQVITSALNVRKTPSGTILGRHKKGDLGTVIGGPTATGRFTWWNIDYDTKSDGWSAGPYLKK